MLCETDNALSSLIPGVGRLVCARSSPPSTLSNSTGGRQSSRSPSPAGRANSLRELRFLASLTDVGLCRILGVVTGERPQWAIIEYGELGDLAHLLQTKEVMENRRGYQDARSIR